MSATEPLVCVKAVRAPFLAAATATGRSPMELAALAGIAPALLGEFAARVPHSTVVRVWDTFAALTGDPAFGVFTAQLLDGAPVSLVDYMLFHAEDVRDLWRRFARYQSLFHDANDVRDEARGDHVAFVHRFRGEPPTSRYFIEFILSMWVARLRRVLGQRLVPVAVSLRYPAPRDETRHLRHFGVPITFGAEQNELVFPRAVFDLRLPQADPSLREQLTRQLESELRQAGGEAAFLERARSSLRAQLLCGHIDVGATARSLATSERTLQRRLREVGTSFRQLLDEVRRDVALGQISRGDVAVSDVAFLLGFSELSTFSRAFRRWTGSSPAAWRRAP
jgi:AraC-like DNA-binding protein